MYTKSGKQRRYLRALAHDLKPVVQLGLKGLTESVLAQIDAQLEHHELIKVRLGSECPDGPDSVTAALADPGDDERPGLRAEVVQAVGHVLVVYRPRKEKPSISLPPVKAGK
ncbi:MAG: ribosome assembly RNA-binding protein YhbY [Polyangia bacterium]|jgi:RNA-binding protein|nr:ribosome assembly RNA-binding protein YhbY [Polyangia bacterium]